jgi:phosphoglycolate phosphatase
MMKCIIFDFDGTIVNSRELAVRLYNECAQKYGYKLIPKDQIESLSGLTIRERLRALDVPFYKLPGLVFEMKSNYSRSLISLQACKGLPELIHMLKEQGYELGIISSNSRDLIQQFLDHNNILGVDRIYCTRNLFGKDKLIKGFLKTWGLAKEDVVYIGDEFRDIAACRKSGVQIIAVTWGFDSMELLEKGSPDYIANHPLEIIKWVHEFT